MFRVSGKVAAFFQPACTRYCGEPFSTRSGGNDDGREKMILNITQHMASAEQKAAGTMDLAAAEAADLKRLLNFDNLPTERQIKERADAIAELARAQLLKIEERRGTPGGAGAGNIRCMIAGAPFIMPALTQAMRSRGLIPVCAFSRRESVDEAQADGSVIKRSVFRHLGFVDLP